MSTLSSTLAILCGTEHVSALTRELFKLLCSLLFFSFLDFVSGYVALT